MGKIYFGRGGVMTKDWKRFVRSIFIRRSSAEDPFLSVSLIGSSAKTTTGIESKTDHIKIVILQDLRVKFSHHVWFHSGY